MKPEKAGSEFIDMENCIQAITGPQRTRQLEADLVYFKNLVDQILDDPS